MLSKLWCFYLFIKRFIFYFILRENHIFWIFEAEVIKLESLKPNKFSPFKNTKILAPERTFYEWPLFFYFFLFLSYSGYRNPDTLKSWLKMILLHVSDMFKHNDKKKYNNNINNEFNTRVTFRAYWVMNTFENINFFVIYYIILFCIA